MDTNAFFMTKLDDIAAKLADSGHNFNIVKASGIADNDIGQVDPVKLGLLTQKGFFPYE